MAKKSKMKSHKGLKKRVKVTATGKILRRKAGKGHLMSSKSGKRRRHLGTPGKIAGPDAKRIRRLLGMA